MTNKEKINKMSCEEFADKFTNRGQNCEVCSYWIEEVNFCLSKPHSIEKCREGFIKWLSKEVELSADEMFEELGYIKAGRFRGCIAYWCDKYKTRITINWNNDEYEKATDFEYQKSRGGSSVSDTITEAEDKAIHKKIEELQQT